MDNSDSIRTCMALHFIESLPSLVRKELLSDTKFMEEVRLETDAVIKIGDRGVAFKRSVLFKAIRGAFVNSSEQFFVEDISSKTWTLCNHPNDSLALSLTDGDMPILINNVWPLCGDIVRRLSIFETESKRGQLSKEEQERWRAVLSEAVVSDDAVSALLIDLDNSPSHIEALLQQEFQRSSIMVPTLVPNDIRYYERLVGKYCRSINIEKYSHDELKQHFESKMESGVAENDLLLCMHKSISKAVATGFLDEASYRSLANRAIEISHPISLVSCLEIGILKFADSSDATLKALFECMSSTKTLENLRLFCSMAIFVDGELARLQIFRGMPPFYRRLASLAQSALIVKVALDKGVAFDELERWASQQRGLHFFCQGFIDLIEEPRWLPTYLTAEQFMNELYGRVNNVCQEFGKCDIVEYLQQELMTDSRLSMDSLLPGPLEGNSTPAVMPDKISSLLTKHINSEASLESFRVLMISAPFWKIDEKYLGLTVSLLESAQHRLAADDDKESVYRVLNGLAQVSCLTRSRKLAASVTALSRLYRTYIDVDSDPENYLALGVVAGAAFQDKDGWSEFIGQWCTELAYLPISANAISRIEAMLKTLCILEPYLYHTCSKALDMFKMGSRN